MSGLIERYRRWFEYEKDVHADLLGVLTQVHPERRDSAAFTESVDLFDHMLKGRTMWLHRLGAGAAPASMDSKGSSLTSVGAVLRAVGEDWTRWLAEADEATLERMITYRTTEGTIYTSRAEDILTQMLTHGAYHRGQIATRLRSIGVDPPSTDFIFWCRRQS
jgi:uncharacterized damage-inducible protein DinB